MAYMDATHEPARYPWPEGFRQHLVEQLDGYSPIVSRALVDNGASLFNDGPYAQRSVWNKIKSVAHEFLWPN